MAGIYIHIPFCKKRCLYCDFYSNTDMTLQKRYVDAVCCELAQRKEELAGKPVETIYLGGGTPSQLSSGSLRRIFDTICREYDLARCREITLEANPDDLTPDYIEALSQEPINRISLGVQSFDDKELLFLNRRHNARQAIEAVNRCRAAGFGNISLDLIYGLPGQTETAWAKNREEAFALSPEHLSCYHLIYEEGTALYRMLKSGELSPADDELSLALFSQLIEHSQAAGYEQYEISNFSQPGFASAHNSSYWQGKPYLGIGASAHSYDGRKTRRMNVANLQHYIDALFSGSSYSESETLSDTDLYNERVLTALRTRKGLYLPELKQRFGDPLYRYCLEQSAAHLQNGTLRLNGNQLELTTEGIFVSDGIMSDLMWVE